MRETEARLCDFLIEQLGYDGERSELVGRAPRELPDVLDSEEILEMVTWVEDAFDVEIDDEEITRENFLTVPQMARYLEGKIAGASAVAPARGHEG
jgi:acyl carrier protein